MKFKRHLFLKDLVMPRSAWAAVLGLAAILLLLGAAMLEHAGFYSGIRPLTFVSTVICVKFALFALWPALSGQARDATSLLKAVFLPEMRDDGLKLWAEREARLNQSVFAANVPTFILNNDQCFLDWNPAFALVFVRGAEAVVKRGVHVKEWYRQLDNFRRVPKRTGQLYGEGILPITDRERVTYLSAEFGRMVFTRIMSPIIDRATGRIIGWSVALNINSVTKRLEFFEQFHAAVSAEARRIRYAASVDGLYRPFAGRRELLAAIAGQLQRPAQVLQLGCGTGTLTSVLLSGGHHVTAVEGDTHQLRVAKERCGDFERLHFVRQNLDQLERLPEHYYDVVVIQDALQRSADPSRLLAVAHAALKPTGRLVLVCRADGATVESLFTALKASLTEQGKFDNLKHQFQHVIEFEREQCAKHASDAAWSYSKVCAQLEVHGFTRIRKRDGFEDGYTQVLVASK